MKKLFFLPALAVALFATSCSSDENAPNPPANAEGQSYMAINLTSLGHGSKAQEPDANFEGSVEHEGTISYENLYFLFFDQNGNAFPLVYEHVNGTTITNMVKPLEPLVQSEGPGADQEGLQGILILGKPGPGYVGEIPAQVLCVANPNSEHMKSLENMTLSTVLDKTTTPPDSWDGKTTNFLMTSASYISGGKLKVTDDVTPFIKKTPEEAKAKPVQINIERLAAKVRVNYGAQFPVQKRVSDTEVQNPGVFTIDNVETKLAVEINGWQLYNTATQSNAFKKLNATYADFTWNWNDEFNKRSYWAETNPGATLRKTSWDLSSADHFTNHTFDSNNPVDNVVYCYENTKFPGIDVNDRTVNKATGIVFKATIKKVNADGSVQDAGLDMMRWSGAYYTVAHLKEKAAKQWSANNGNAAYDAAKVAFVSDGTNKNTYHAVYNISTDNSQDIPLFTNILWWRNGVTSYYTNIEHLGGLYGVVRNHIYDYTISGLVGLGIPGNNPDVPEEVQQYVACHVRVINWHLVSHDVNLE